ncbi:hypothetical protein M0M57_14775 [Flavobacterium azooxidireducens]|uniref:DUF4230 domain-containing protein n=1 Tax=Flavobacterium azooxidireducens TaxID=1871076 RepID=A0ABY4KEX2_9FLAO|nr:hypothetical protein [Flavobacterium azooxidireducens]UPQ78870.1 hypothetical protein M0M57_14775 [Flavobacterium azooxidireducens]
MKRRESKNNFIYFGIAIVAITFLFVLFSYEKPSRFCKNELFIISTDSLLKFNLKLNQLKDSLAKDVEHFFYDSDICDKNINFGLILSNKEVVNVSVFKECDLNLLMSNRNRFSILLNHKGQLLLDEDMTTIDSIPNKILKQFINDYSGYEKHYSPYQNLHNQSFFVNWRLLTPKDSIEKVLLKTQEGFVKIYDELANKRYSKNLCELNEKELFELKNGFDCHLVLDFFPLPPPPPPPTIIK